MAQHSFQNILKDSFLKRKNANPQYSLRAFARDLDMEPAQLSRVFSGKQNISPQKAKVVSSQLFDTEIDCEYFVSLVEIATAKNEKELKAAGERAKRIREESQANISSDELSHLSSWLHLALLDLLAIRPFTPKHAPLMAKLLGVTVQEIQLTLECLQSAGFIVSKQGRLEKVTQSLRTTTNVPSAVIRNLHRQFIQKGLEALDTQAIDRRYFTSKTFAISSEDQPKVRALVDELNRKVSELVSKSKDKNELYQLNVQNFALLKGEK